MWPHEFVAFAPPRSSLFREVTTSCLPLGRSLSEDLGQAAVGILESRARSPRATEERKKKKRSPIEVSFPEVRCRGNGLDAVYARYTPGTEVGAVFLRDLRKADEDSARCILALRSATAVGHSQVTAFL